MSVILDVILILFFSKLLGGLLESIKMVELLGAIFAGILLGPVFGIVEASSIEPFGKIGLILILFLAGFEEFRIAEILKEKLGIMSTGLLGGLIPFVLGYFAGTFFGFTAAESLFMGGVMSATSVSVSVGTLISTRKINTKVGRYILTSSIIDDLVGIFLLIFIIGFATTGTISIMDVLVVLGKIAAFGAFFAVVMIAMPALFRLVFRVRTEEMEISTALVIILFLAYLSEALGFSSVIGAFLGGVVLSKISALKTRIEIEKFKAIALGFFVPFFFAWVGLQMSIDLSLITWFTLVFVLVAMFGKIIAAFFSGAIAKMKPMEMLALGIARMPRGEIALSILIIGKNFGVVPDVVFGATLILMLATIILTPLLLSPLMSGIKA